MTQNNIQKMIPRERVLKPTGTKKFDMDPHEQFDQKTIKDFRVGGTIAPKSQFVLSSKYDDEYRKKHHKNFPLRNSVPYIPPVNVMNTRPAINLFDPRQFQLAYAMNNSRKSPVDVSVNEPLAHRKKKAIKLGEKIYLLRAERAEDDLKHWIKDNIQLQQKVFLKDRDKGRQMHDLKAHRTDVIKNGLAEQNPFESTHKLMAILKEIQKQGDKIATAHMGPLA